MGKLIYKMGGMSADGYIVGPDGRFDWTQPDEELHEFHKEQLRSRSGYLLGRRLYETMLYWETVDTGAEAGDFVREFAAIWRTLPKVVFSRTLESVQGESTTLARRSLEQELAALRQSSSEGDIEIGGAELAAQAIRLKLVDEYWLLLNPVAVGGGTPFFPRDQRVDMELVETRTFTSQVVFLKYRAR